MELALRPAKGKPALFLRKRLKMNKDEPERRVWFPGWAGALTREPVASGPAAGGWAV